MTAMVTENEIRAQISPWEKAMLVTGCLERGIYPNADAAIDPFAQPDVKAALQRTSFELLVGFNLTQDQLRYNATR